MESALDIASTEDKRAHLRDMGLPSLFGAVVLLVSATLMLGANISALHSSLKWMEHSQQVLTRISELETGVLGAELTVRGYALTGDASFIRYQQTGRRRFQTVRADLERLMVWEPQRAAEFRRTMQDLTRHTQILDGLAGLGPGKSQVVARAIVDPAVRANVRSTRNGLAGLRAKELRDLAVRQREMTSQIFRAFFLAMGIIVAAFILAALGLFATQLRGLRNGREANPDRRIGNQNLQPRGS
jgi:CHASE3 domain sensor protein